MNRSGLFPNFISRQHVFYAALLALMVISGSILVQNLVPFSVPYPNDITAARAFLNETPADPFFVRVASVYLLALGLKIGEVGGVILVQTIVYMVIVFAVYFLLGFLLKISPKLSFFGSLCVALHPQIVLNIMKVMDTQLSTLAVVLLLILLARLKAIRRLEGPLFFLWAGFIIGFAVLVRTQYVLFIPLFLFVSFSNDTPLFRKKIKIWALTLLTAFLLIGAASYPVKGTLNPSDSYYATWAFFDGNHPGAKDALLSHQNGEYLSTNHLKEGWEDLPKAQLKEALRQTGIKRIKENPLEWVELLFIKLYVLFQPDYRRVLQNPLGSPFVIYLIQMMLASFFWVWLYLKIRCRVLQGASAGLISFAFVFLYLLPFMITNADPRYRIPLDICFVVDIFYMLSQSSKKQTA